MIRWKEILESFEFFGLARKYVRRDTIADVCCGHGLTGVLFALLEKKVEHVSLIDETMPPSTERVLEVACELAPWVRDKMTLVEARIAEGGVELPRETGVVAVHACGALTDDAIDLAIDLGGPVAVMPCCCHPKSPDAPQVLYQELGVRDGVDTHRTYRLHQAGYKVKWRYVAEDITPMNRVIIGGKFSRRL